MTDSSQTARQPLSWGDFAAQVAVIANVEEGRITRETLVVRDLDLDSLALLEVVVSLVVDLGVEELSQKLQDADWTKVTVGELYDEHVSQKPSAWKFELR